MQKKTREKRTREMCCFDMYEIDTFNSHIQLQAKKIFIFLIFAPKTKGWPARVIYNRVQNRKNYFEIPTFLQIERGKSRVGKIQNIK